MPAPPKRLPPRVRQPVRKPPAAPAVASVSITFVNPVESYLGSGRDDVRASVVPSRAAAAVKLPLSRDMALSTGAINLRSGLHLAFLRRFK